MLSTVDPGVAEELAAIRYVPTVVVVLRYPAAAAVGRPRGAGFLVPRDERRLLGACTWLSAKWPQLAEGGELWARCSIARASAPAALGVDDELLVAHVTEELRDAAGVQGKPLSAHVTRWERALPLYEPGHLDRVARAEERLERLPGMELAGAAYGGIGVPHCITGGRRAAERILAALAGGGHGVRDRAGGA